MEEGKSDRGQGLAPLSVNLTSSYISQHGITYAEILLQRKLRKMSHMLQRNNGWCIATLHMSCVHCASQLISKEKTNLCAIHFLVGARFVQTWFVTVDKSQDRISLHSTQSIRNGSNKWWQRCLQWWVQLTSFKLVLAILIQMNQDKEKTIEIVCCNSNKLTKLSRCDS